MYAIFSLVMHFYETLILIKRIFLYHAYETIKLIWNFQLKYANVKKELILISCCAFDKALLVFWTQYRTSSSVFTKTAPSVRHSALEMVILNDVFGGNLDISVLGSTPNAI